jgi:hypothetical protein
VAKVRKAGGEEIAGKIQERAGILAALADNPLTRSWQGTMDRFVTGPIGRKMASDEVLEKGVGNMIAGLPVVDGLPHSLAVEAANRYAGRTDLTPEALADIAASFVDSGEVENVNAFIGNQTRDYVADGSASRSDQEAVAAQLAQHYGGRMGLTKLGSQVRQAGLGSPVAAYVAVGGSTALLVKGAMDVYARMQAGEPVSEEEVVVASKVLSEAGVR